MDIDMNSPRVHEAIRTALYDVFSDALRRATPTHQVPGDMIAKAIRDGVKDGIVEVFKHSAEFGLPGDRFTKALEEGTRQAILQMRKEVE